MSVLIVETGVPELDEPAKRCDDAFKRAIAIFTATLNNSDAGNVARLRRMHAEALVEHAQARQDFELARRNWEAVRC